MAQPTLSIFTGSKGLGTIFQEQNQINIKFLEASAPTTKTDQRLSLRKNAVRFIIIQGAHDGTGFDGATPEGRLSDFIYEMEQWFNVNTTSYSKAVYTDGFGVTYTVDAVDWSWKRSFAQPFRIIYTLMLIEGVSS